MNILIITTWFPPAVSIAAIRPYMFAKYLMQCGHHVEILCSDIVNRKVDTSNLYPTDDFCVHMYQSGMTADAVAAEGKVPNGRRLGFLPYRFRRFISVGYHKLTSGSAHRRRTAETKAIFSRQKEVLDRMKDRHFDVVLSTFNALENVYAGEYAAQLFGCKWVQDFRDPITALGTNHIQKAYYKKIQDAAVRKADLSITVAEDLAEYLASGTGKQVQTVYNGYERTDEHELQKPEGKLSFCYTGALYGGKRKFTPLFKVLREMIRAGEVREDELVFHYAGKDFSLLRQQAEQYRLEGCLQDHGYLNRKDTDQLQKESDFYLVLSWNNGREEVGVLTGKLYEGIRARKPIVALISGKKPNAELRRIVDRYQLGCGYEQTGRKTDEKNLHEYLLKQIGHKRQTGAVRHQPSEEAEIFFRYDHIVAKLENLLRELCDERNIPNEQ